MPQYDDTDAVWSTTDSNSSLWHAFDADGHALCNRRIWARWHARSTGQYRTRQQVENSPLSTAHDRCVRKVEERAEAARLAAAAAQLAETVDADQAPAVHHFDSTGEAYNATQSRDDIRDGDVLVIEREGVVGFLVEAWPAAITEHRGELHALTSSAWEIKGGRYRASADAAAQIARGLWLPLAGGEHRVVEGELLDDVEMIEQAKVVDGTWRGGWIASPPPPTGDALFDLDQGEGEQGALFD